jgi:glyoxylase-like metal-dependent hydrolase (beta-lactamase superfamily II)/rhodanese-related sulfurtransferase
VTQASISASDLRTLLEQGRPVRIIDIRRADDREWTIPGSVTVDAYDAVNAGRLGGLGDVAFDSRPAVMVCGRGHTARRATELLRAQGVDALTLEGGMQAWSTAWNSAYATVGRCEVVQVRRTGKGCLSYIVASDGAALVVDASLAPEIYAELLKARGWRLIAVVDTHIHADHLSRSRRLAKMTGAALYMPVNDRVRFDFQHLADLDRIPFGASELVALRTSGHTAESTTYVLDNLVAFTGDTLFVDGVGRPDLHGGHVQARANAALLYTSVCRLLQLPAKTLLLPGHVAAPVPFDNVLLTSTIDAARAMSLLRMTESEFLAATTEHLQPPPSNHSRIIAANELGEWPDDAEDLEAGANRCAVS